MARKKARKRKYEMSEAGKENIRAGVRRRVKRQRAEKREAERLILERKAKRARKRTA